MILAGVSLEFLRKVSDAPTGRAYILIDKKGENSIIIDGGANMKYETLQ